MTWDFVGIISADLEESVRFYRLLGCNFPDPNGQDHIEAIFPNGMRLALDSVELMKRIGHWEQPSGIRMGIAFNAGTPDEVNRVYKELTDASFEGCTAPYDAFWGQRYAQILDPDGNKVDIYANL